MALVVSRRRFLSGARQNNPCAKLTPTQPRLFRGAWIERASSLLRKMKVTPPLHLTSSSILRLLCFLTARVHRLNKFVNASSSCLRFKLFINFVVFCVHSDSRIYITFSFLFIGILTIQISFPNNSEYFVRTLNIEDDFLRIWRRILCIFVRSNSSEDLSF